MAKKQVGKKGSVKQAGASATRVEKDTMGEMTVPAGALYGASTQRAVENFPVSGRAVPGEVIRAFAALKSACATVNEGLDRLDGGRAKAIRKACADIEGGLEDHGGFAAHFPVDVFQTGSGTSTNMNVNEVVANLVCLAKGAAIGSSKDADYLKKGGVHPNDHVNAGQSSNDTFPTAMHIAGAVAIQRDLIPALETMHAELSRKAKAWDKIVKIGRTHLQDATPIRLGQEFSGYAQQVAYAIDRAKAARDALAELPIGGTAVGTGINTHPKFGKLVCEELTKHFASIGGKKAGKDALKFREAKNHFEAQHAKDGCVEASGLLKTIATSFSKIANDIRWLGSGPRCGIGELKLPAVQPGSSIMPGKVNPVICESLIMVACEVSANDHAVTLCNFGGVGSVLDLNVAMPLMAERLLGSVHLLANGALMFTGKLLVGLEPDEERCAELIEGSLAMCTSLVPVIGYDKSAAIAYQAYREGRTVREVAISEGVLSEAELKKLLNPMSMTKAK
jgi:fumarate hydratase class II